MIGRSGRELLETDQRDQVTIGFVRHDVSLLKSSPAVEHRRGVGETPAEASGFVQSTGRFPGNGCTATFSKENVNSPFFSLAAWSVSARAQVPSASQWLKVKPRGSFDTPLP